MSLFRVSGLLLGATLFSAVMGQGCGCPPPPPPDAGPGDGPTLAFSGLAGTVNCDTDDADPGTAGFQLEVEVVISDDDGSGYADVEITNSRGDVTPAQGAFDNATATVIIEVVPDAEAPGAENTLTATSTNGSETITTSETVRVICEEAPVEAECRFVSPPDGDVLTVDPTPVTVECSIVSGTPTAEQQALVDSGTVVVTADPESVAITLAGGTGTGDLDLPDGVSPLTITLELNDPSGLFAAAITDSIDVTVEAVAPGILITEILVVNAGLDRELNIADNGGAEAAGNVTSDVEVTLDAAFNDVVTATTTAGTCSATASGTSVTLPDCPFAQGAADIVVTGSGLSTTGNARANSVDTVRPVVTIDAPAQGAVLTSADDVNAGTAGLQANVVVASDDDTNGETATVLVDSVERGSGTIAGGAATVVTTIAEGTPRVLTATAADALGNVGTSAPVSVTVDSAAPVLDLDVPATLDSTDDLDSLSGNGIQVDVTVTPTGLAAGSLIVIESDLDNVISDNTCLSAGEGVAVQCEVTFVTDGAHDVTATATDDVGNVGTSNVVTTDAQTGLIGVNVITPPIRNGFRSISALEDTTAGGGTAEIVVSGTTAPGGIVTLVLNGTLVVGATDTADGTGAFSFTTTLNEGQTGTFEVRVTSGLESGTSGIDNFRVDIGRPTTSFSNPAGATVDFSATQDTSAAPGLQLNVVVDVSECEDGVLQVRDGATVIGTNNAIPAGGTGNFTVAISDLTEGQGETWTAVCTDAEGNTPVTPDSFTANVDFNAPDAVDIAVTVVSVREGDVTLEFVEPGDTGAAGGDIDALEIVASRTLITAANFDTLAAVPFGPGGGGGGIAEAITGAGSAHVVNLTGLAFDNTWHFAVRATDDAGNESLGLATLAITDFDTDRSSITRGETDVADGATIDDSFAGAALGSGDLNGDGFNDVVLTASNQGDACDLGLALCDGRLHIFGGGAGDIGTGPTRVLSPPAGTLLFGVSAALLRLNGDDNADLIVAGYAADLSEGRVFIYYGVDGNQFVGNTPDATLTTALLSGDGVMPVGDVSNDGFDDFVLVSTGASDTEITLVRGSATPLSGTAAAAGLANATTLQLGTAAGATVFLTSVTGAGQVDADAINDFVVVTDGAAETNQLWVIAGRATWPATLDVGTATRIACPGASCGQSALTSGDFNGDGNSDLIVPSVSRFNVHLGSGTALAATPSVLIDVAGLLSPIFATGTIGAIGDFNGDGRVDLVGGRRTASVSTFAVYFGSASTVARNVPDIDYPVDFGDSDSPSAVACGNYDGDTVGGTGFDDLCFAVRTAGGGDFVLQR